MHIKIRVIPCPVHILYTIIGTQYEVAYLSLDIVCFESWIVFLELRFPEAVYFPELIMSKGKNTGVFSRQMEASVLSVLWCDLNIFLLLWQQQKTLLFWITFQIRL